MSRGNDYTIRRWVAARLWSSASGRPVLGKYPDEADRAATELMELYEFVNDATIEDLYDDWYKEIEKLKGTDEEQESATSDYFGDLLAKEALGMARQATFESVVTKIPRFAVNFDGKELTWDGDSEDLQPWGGIQRGKGFRARRNPAIPSQESYLGETLGSPEFISNPRHRRTPEERARRKQRSQDRQDRRANELRDEVMAAMRQHGSLEYPQGFRDALNVYRLGGREERILMGMARDGYIERRSDGRWYASPGMESMRFSEEVPNPACPACGAHIASGAQTCPSCGIRVRAGSGLTAIPVEPPRHLVTRRGRPPGVPVGNPGAYVRVGRMPTDAELASAWRYIEREYTLKEGVVDGEQWAEGLAFGDYEGTADDRATVAEMKPQLTEVQWRSIAYRADYIRADQGIAPKFTER